MLQVADIALNRPFKAGLRTQFEQWAAEVILEQIKAGQQPDVKEQLRIKHLRPRLLQWCYLSWMELRTPKGRNTVQRGWNRCVTQFFDVFNEDKRRKAEKACIRNEFAAYDVVPETEEPAPQPLDLWDDDDSGDELDETQPVREGTRRGQRKRASGQKDLATALLELVASDDSELELD